MKTTNDCLTYSYLPSPLGDLLVTSDGLGLTGIFFPCHQVRISPQPDWDRDEVPFQRLSTQLADYFAGDLRAFDVPLSMRGSRFEMRVWRALQEISYGTTISYGEVARRIGQPTASRAVGLANGRNPIPILVPCHRVIGANGRLVGYGGGLETKQFLLDLEQSFNAKPQAPAPAAWR